MAATNFLIKATLYVMVLTIVLFQLFLIWDPLGSNWMHSGGVFSSLIAEHEAATMPPKRIVYRHKGRRSGRTHNATGPKMDYFSAQSNLSSSAQLIDYDEQIDTNFEDQSIPINRLQTQWQTLLYDTLIKCEFFSILLTDPQYSSTAHLFVSNVSALNDKLNVADNIQAYNDLLTTSHAVFTRQLQNSQHVQNAPFVYFRQILSIRRYLMILNKYLSEHITQQSDIALLPALDTKTYHSLLHNIFVPIRQKYVSSLQTDEKYRKYWYLIHVSKSAGSSICATQTDIGYKQLNYGGTNCNIPGHGIPIKNNDPGSLSCAELEFIRMNENTEFIGSERPMTGHRVSNQPIMCHKYHYIFPIRNPLKRIASTLSEFNAYYQYWPFQLLTFYGDNSTGFVPALHGPRKRHCFHQMITIDHSKTYGSLRDAEEFRGFLPALFKHEEQGEEDQVEVIWHNNYKCKAHSFLDDANQQQYHARDQTYIEWLGDDKQFAVKVTEGFKDRSNAAHLRGYSSNIYTRWVGYQRHEKSASETVKTYDAIFAKSYEVNITHWLNAVRFMMSTDYVLPFDSKFEHEIFDYALKDLWGFHGDEVRENEHDEHEVSDDGVIRRRLARLVSHDVVHKVSKRKAREMEDDSINGVYGRAPDDYVYEMEQEAQDFEAAQQDERFPDVFLPERMVNRKRRYVKRFNRDDWQQRGSGYVSKTRWQRTHTAMDYRQQIPSFRIIGEWSDQEVDYINNKNLLDLALFRMAYWIADADADFYALLATMNQTDSDEQS